MVYYVTEVDTTPVLMELSIKSEKQNDDGYILQTDICSTDIRENMEWWITIGKLGWGVLSWWSQEHRLFKSRTRPKESHGAKMGAESGVIIRYESDSNYLVVSGSDSIPQDNMEPRKTGGLISSDFINTQRSWELDSTSWRGKILLQSSRSCTTHVETFGHISPHSPPAGVLSRHSVCRFCLARRP